MLTLITGMIKKKKKEKEKIDRLIEDIKNSK